MTRALIFVPPNPDEATSANFARHVHRRGYQLAGRISDWASAVQAMTDRIVSVVVVACNVHYSRTYRAPGTTTVPIPLQKTTQAAGRHRRPLSPRLVGSGLMAVTAGVGLAWTGLQIGEVDAQWPSYALASTMVGSWVPYVGWIVDRAWREDVAVAELHGQIVGERDGYSTGFVDAIMMRSP